METRATWIAKRSVPPLSSRFGTAISAAAHVAAIPLRVWVISLPVHDASGARVPLLVGFHAVPSHLLHLSSRPTCLRSR